MLFRFPKFTSVTIIQELPFALIPNKSPRIRFSHVASIKNTTRHMISCYIAMRKRIQAFPCKCSLSTIAHRHIRVFAWSLTANKIYSIINRCKDYQFPSVITAKPKAHAFKNEMCFPLTKTKCELKKHPNSKFECFFNDFNRTKTSLFLPFPSKLIQDNLVCVLELQE